MLMTRYLALDLGDRRIGIAVSDAAGMIARPLEVLRRGARVADYAHLQRLVDQHGIEAIIVGLPLNMDGSEGPQALWVRDYGLALAEALGVPVHFWDERLTTVEATDLLHAQGKQAERDSLDAVAAAVILQSYLDAHSSRPGCGNAG